MKIAVFHNLPTGGAKRALHGHVKYLTESGHSVEVFVPSTADESYLPLKSVANKVSAFPVKSTFAGLAYSAIKYVPYMKARMPVSLRDLENTQEDIARTINEGDCDVVLCEQDQFIASPFILRYLKKPTVYYCQQPRRYGEALISKLLDQARGGRPLSPVKNYLRNRYVNKVLRLDRDNASFSRYMLANSYYSRESILRNYGLNSFVSYLGVDTGLFRPLNLPRDQFALSVGSCVPDKGFDFLIRSLACVKKSLRPDLVLVSNSANPLWKECLERLAISLDVNLRILQSIDDTKLVELYNKARVVLYAPYLEPFGLVPLEAMACGTPVVGVCEGGVRESILHDKTGILTDRDESAFAAAVERLLTDEDKQKAMAARAVDQIRAMWTQQKAGDRLLAHLETAARGRGNRRTV